MATITGEIVIERPVDVVFDFVADERNEPKFNPRMSRAEKLTDGPIGLGSRFLATVTSGGRPVDMQIEVTSYDRPKRLAAQTSTESAEIRGTLTFEPEGDATRMRWSWDLEPKGALKLLMPLVVRVGERQETSIWTGLKRYLEADRQRRPRDGDSRGPGVPNQREAEVADLRGGPYWLHAPGTSG